MNGREFEHKIFVPFGGSIPELPFKDTMKALENLGFVRLIRVIDQFYHRTGKSELPFDKWIGGFIDDFDDYLKKEGQDPLTNTSLRMMQAVRADYQNFPDAVDNMLRNMSRETPSLVSDQWAYPVISLPSLS